MVRYSGWLCSTTSYTRRPGASPKPRHGDLAQQHGQSGRLDARGDRTGFGDATQPGVLSLSPVHNGALYVGTMNGATTGGEVWRTADGDRLDAGATWTALVTPRNCADTSSLALRRDLYAGTYNSTTGGQIWRCAKCDGATGHAWWRDGFGSVGEPACGRPDRLQRRALCGHQQLRSATAGGVAHDRRRQTGHSVAPAGFGDSNNRGPTGATR